MKPSVEDLFRSEHLRLLRLGFLLSSDRQVAEDAVQEAFASLTQRHAEIEKPAAYLRQAVVNRINDAHRRSARRPASRDKVAVQAPELDETWDLVQGLPCAQRAVVVLRFYEDLRLVDIAAMLGRPESTVRSDLRRALQHLRSELGR